MVNISDCRYFSHTAKVLVTGTIYTAKKVSYPCPVSKMSEHTRSRKWHGWNTADPTAIMTSCNHAALHFSICLLAFGYCLAFI